MTRPIDSNARVLKIVLLPTFTTPLAILLFGACSLTSLDHLQGGPGRDAGDAQVGAGGRKTQDGTTLDSGTGVTDGSADRDGRNTGGGTDAAGGATGTGGSATGTGGGATGTGGGANDPGGDAAGTGGSAAGASAIDAAADTSARDDADTRNDGATPVDGGTGTEEGPWEPTMTYGIAGQSCSGGLSCGASASCCAQSEVPQLPEETFMMGSNTDPDGVADEKPPHAANVDGFMLDQFEVTVGRFRRFVQAYDGTRPAEGAGAHPKHANSGWQAAFNAQVPTSQGELQDQIGCNGTYQTWTNTAGTKEMMPMNCVTWYVAFAFCIWDGGRLPTEAEWEKAAAGGALDQRFPWGNRAPNPATDAVMCAPSNGDAGCQPSALVAVGSRPAGAGRWGHLDLAGSLWEWNLDYYDSTYYQSVGTCDNCVSLEKNTPRVIRGGDFTSPMQLLRATKRASYAPVSRYAWVGFRCARSL